MKKTELIFLGILLPLDFLALYLAGIIAYLVRFTPPLLEIKPAVSLIPFSFYQTGVIILSFFYIFIFAVSGLYSRARRKLSSEIGRIILACSTGVMAAIVFIFFRGEFFASRFIVLAAWALSIIFIISERLILRSLYWLMLRAGINIYKVAIIGNTKTAELLKEEFSRHPRHGRRVITVYNQWSDDIQKELNSKAEAHQLDEILVTDPSLSRDILTKIKTFCDARHLNFRYSADLLAEERVEFYTISGIPIAEVQRTPLEGWGRIFKRIFDIIAALILLILFSPIMLVIAISIAIDSPGPVFFSHTRIGQYGKPFRFWKFRSMHKGAEEKWEEIAKISERHGPLPKLREDPRITKVGRFIRKWSLDELPQLWNVLLGNMSLVGPRPHLKEEVAQYEARHKRVLEVKPGITGLSQVSGRADLHFEDEIRLDTYYISNWSPWLDLITLLKTPITVLSRRGAY